MTRVWQVLETTNHTCNLVGYQSSEYKKWPIIYTVTKAQIKGWDDLVLLSLNYTTVVDNENELEFLCQPYDLMSHGIKVDLVAQHLGESVSAQQIGREDVYPILTLQRVEAYLHLNMKANTKRDRHAGDF